MWFCFIMSFIYFIMWLMAMSHGNASDANYAATIGAIWTVGVFLISEIRKGRNQ